MGLPEVAQVRFPLAVSAVVIDLDGTLLDTAGDLAAAANMMLRELGIGERDPELIKSFIGKGIHNLVKRVLTGRVDVDPPEDLFERALPLYENRYFEHVCVRTQPYPGVIEGLDAMRAAGFPLACVTNKKGLFTEALLERTRLRSYFEVVVAGDTTPRKKPDPLPLLYAAEKLGIPPARLLLVGDSVNDVQAARAAGCPVFCVPYGYNEGRDVRELEVDAIVPSLIEAARLIRKA